MGLSAEIRKSLGVTNTGQDWQRRKARHAAKNRLWCGLFLVLIVACAKQADAQTTQQKSLISWPQLKDGFFPQISEDGRRVAVRVGLGAQVWSIEADGQLGKMLWNSRTKYPKLVAHGFAWRGADLILSLGDNRDPLYRLDFFSTRDIGPLPVSKGNTLLIDLQSDKATELLQKSYRYLTVDPTHKYLAAASPTDVDSKDAVIEFFELNVQQARLSGRLEKKGWGRGGNSSPSIIGWSDASRGVHVIGREDGKTAGKFGARDALFHLARDGKRSEILPENAWVTPLRRTALPLAFPMDKQGLSVHIRYLAQGGEYVIVNLKGIQKSTRFVEGKSLLNGKIRVPRALAMTPNGRFIVFEDYFEKYDERFDFPPGYQVNIWILDTTAKRARKVISTGVITAAHQWSGNRLLVETDDNTGEAHSLGLLQFDEATVAADDPKLDVLVAQSSWEDAAPPKPPPSATQMAAEAFLRQPVIVPLDLPQQWKVPFSRRAEWKDLTVYAIGLSNQDSHFIVVDPKTNRVVAFVAPPPRPPLPPEPIAPERAREIAEAFARTQKPELFKLGGAVQAEVEPQITERATYRVHLQGEGATGGVEIEVRASDGKIAAYRESTELAKEAPRQQGQSTPIAFVDRAPRWSPDGRQIAFLSNRSREGYPAWWPGRPSGLYVVNVDGSDLRNVAPEASSPAQWSPDGRRLAYRTGEAVLVYDLVKQTSVTAPSPQDKLIEPRLFCWLNADHLLFGWVHNGPGHCDLVRWQPGQPQQPPEVLVKDWSAQVGNDWGGGGFALSGDGRTLYFAWLNLNDIGNPCPYSLYALSVDELKAKPMRLTNCLPVGASVQWSTAGILATDRDKAVLVDVVSGQSKEWQAPEAVARMRRSGNMDEVGLSADGRQLAVTAYVQVSPPDKATSTEQGRVGLIHIADANGSNIEAVTSAEATGH